MYYFSRKLELAVTVPVTVPVVKTVPVTVPAKTAPTTVAYMYYI